MSANVERLSQAIRNRSEDTWRQLLGVMSSTETNSAGDEYGSRPLHWACAKDNVPAAVDLLKTPGIEVNVLNSVTIAKRAASMTLNETSVSSSRSFIRLGTVSTCSTSIHTESMYVRVGRGARRFESKAPFYQC